MVYRKIASKIFFYDFSRDKNDFFQKKILENRLFNRLLILPKAWNLFQTILRVFLHKITKKVGVGVCC